MADLGLFTNCGILVGAYDISGMSNAIAATLSKEVLDRSVFGSTARVKALGLEAAQIAAAGFLDQSVDIENTYWGANVPVTIIIPTTAGAAPAAGDRAIFFNAIEAGFTRGGRFGEDALFNFQATGDQDQRPIGVGFCLNPGRVAVTADNTPAATVVQAGAVLATQKLYAVLHVTDVSTADSIVVKIQSAAAANMAGAVDRITFDSKSAIGYQIAAPVSGAITDEYWRAYADITEVGDPCSIKFACSIAIR